MHRLRPRDHVIQAHLIGAYPAACVAGAALMLMVQNNLDANVAQFPHELVTYGGNGSAFSNWAQYRLTMQLLSTMTDRQTLCLHSRVRGSKAVTMASPQPVARRGKIPGAVAARTPRRSPGGPCLVWGPVSASLRRRRLEFCRASPRVTARPS